MSFRLRAPAALLLFFCHLPAYADVMYLKNGDVFSGEIISFNDGVCIFNTLYETPVRLDTRAIRSLSTDSEYEIFFVGGDRTVGRFSENGDKQSVLESSTFGVVNISIASISSMTKKVFIDEDNVAASDGPVQGERGYGEQDTEEPPLDFLTGSTVLLSPGQYEVDVGMMYKQLRNQNSLYSVGRFQKSAQSARMFGLTTTVRTGITEGIEGHLSLPVTYSHIEDVSSNEYVRSARSWDLADIGFGLQYQLINESASLPAVSLTMDISAPTGRKKYHDALNDWKDPLNNGSGHWSVMPGIAFVRTADPAILFGGIGYRHSFADTIDDYHVKPGWMLASYFGVGFGLNEKTSLGTRLSYAYSSTVKVDGERIYGSDLDPVDLSFNLSYRAFDDWVISPQVTFGLNADAGPAAFSVNLKRRFD